MTGSGFEGSPQKAKKQETIEAMELKDVEVELNRKIRARRTPRVSRRSLA